MKWLKRYLMVNEIKDEIRYTDYIFNYIKSKNKCGCYNDGLNGKIDRASKQAYIMGYIKSLEDNDEQTRKST